MRRFPDRVVSFECSTPPSLRGQFYGDGGLGENDVCFIKIPPGMPIAIIGGALGICASLALIYRFLIRGKIPGADVYGSCAVKYALHYAV